MGLRYRELNLKTKKDREVMNRILSFDTDKNCFGDYDFYQVANEYINLAVYMKNKLIGYIGFAYMNEETKYTITICIKKEYQSLGLGDTILKQTINTLFSDYECEIIDLEAIEDNSKCNKLIEKNHFSKEKTDRFLRNGEFVRTNHYIYTKEDYNNEKNKFKVYEKII